jgi:uncharacterized membrane protein YraQ (UPF0718 family)
MTALLNKYRLFLTIVVINGALGLYSPPLGWLAANKTLEFLLEVLAFIPTIMVLMGLLDVWVPRQLVENNLGSKSGVRGIALAVFLGTAAAGPLYAAFPIGLTLRQKGAKLGNIVIFLGSWAAIKIPMILLESSFIGIEFALLRLAFTLPGVIGMGLLMDRLLPETESDVSPLEVGS